MSLFSILTQAFFFFFSLGGAERLFIDAALGLQQLGHFVTIYTSHFDPKRAFDEVRDGTIKVKVLGNTLVPRNISGKFSIVCAMLRQLHLLYCLKNSEEGSAYDVFIVDQLSICVPFLRQYLPKGKILFYGHFPDKLLADHESIVKKIYRAPFDWLEQWSTGLSDVIVVNSKFTKSVYREAFPKITVDPEVLYPCVNTKEALAADSEIAGPFPKNSYVLSVNRFEPHKNIRLALEAFAKAIEDVPANEIAAGKYKLVLAGGYDPRLEWNVSYLTLLRTICDKLGLANTTVWPADGEDALATPSVQKSTVIFLPSVADSIKKKLMANAALLTYTPNNEHFGIVPLEAMLVGTPVLATNTGGPLETIVHGKTGWNYPGTVEKWAPAIKYALFEMPPAERTAMSAHARERVFSQFSETQMAREFEKYSQQAVATVRDPKKGDLRVLETLALIILAIVPLVLFVFIQLLKNSYK